MKPYYDKLEGDIDNYFMYANDDAIVQARVARMLRVDEFKGGKPILWSYEPLNIDLRNAHLPTL